MHSRTPRSGQGAHGQLEAAKKMLLTAQAGLDQAETQFELHHHSVAD
jgi:hypothetical protein